MYKKIISVCLILSMLFSGCAKEKAEDTPTATPTPLAETTIDIVFDDAGGYYAIETAEKETQREKYSELLTNEDLTKYVFYADTNTPVTILCRDSSLDFGHLNTPSGNNNELFRCIRKDDGTPLFYAYQVPAGENGIMQIDYCKSSIINKFMMSAFDGVVFDENFQTFTSKDTIKEYLDELFIMEKTNDTGITIKGFDGRLYPVKKKVLYIDIEVPYEAEVEEDSEVENENGSDVIEFETPAGTGTFTPAEGVIVTDPEKEENEEVEETDIIPEEDTEPIYINQKYYLATSYYIEFEKTTLEFFYATYAHTYPESLFNDTLLFNAIAAMDKAAFYKAFCEYAQTWTYSSGKNPKFHSFPIQERETVFVGSVLSFSDFMVGDYRAIAPSPTPSPVPTEGAEDTSGETTEDAEPTPETEEKTE